jgi:hypothetical protein
VGIIVGQCVGACGRRTDDEEIAGIKCASDTLEPRAAAKRLKIC